ncbi:MAG: carboxypeptidase regulatory-like domain-containing protein [Prevotella sp.]|nr:carboxypeptidase regulatory-like domain-containing protein [Prevotella sp.]
MKKNLNKALLLTLGLGLAVSLTSCHSGSDESVPVITQDITPTHSIRGTILDGNGAALNGASVVLSRQGTASTRQVTVSGNHFEVAGLADGTWDVVVTKNGYNTLTESVSLAVTTMEIEGKNSRVGQNVDQVFYLFEEVKSNAIKLGEQTSSSDEIVIETTTQDDGTGNVVNTTDPAGDQATAGTISVEAETPAISGEDYDNVADQLKAQGGSIEDFSMFLVNINSLEDAKKLADDNNMAGSRVLTRATTAMPGGQELLAGVGIDAGPYVIELTGDNVFELTITLPDENVKGATTLFRTITGDSWTPLTTGNGILGIDRSQPGKIIIRMSTIQTQSIALGMRITETNGNTEYEPVEPQTIVNNGTAARSISSMDYVVKEGVVLQNTVQGPLTDFLRKLVLRLYGTRAVSEAAPVTKTYSFTPAFSLPVGGTLNLLGTQRVLNKNYSVANGSAAFNAREYSNAYVYTYATYPETENTHVGGGN